MLVVCNIRQFSGDHGLRITILRHASLQNHCQPVELASYLSLSLPISRTRTAQGLFSASEVLNHLAQSTNASGAGLESHGPLQWKGWVEVEPAVVVFDPSQTSRTTVISYINVSKSLEISFFPIFEGNPKIYRCLENSPRTESHDTREAAEVTLSIRRRWLRT